MSARDEALDPMDPRLTAYALGELDRAERGELERLLAANPEAREFVDELAATAQALEREFRMELATTSHARPIVAMSRVIAAGRARYRPRRIWMHAAALLALLGGSAFVFVQSVRRFGGEPVFTDAAAEEQSLAMLSCSVQTAGAVSTPQGTFEPLDGVAAPEVLAPVLKREVITQDEAESEAESSSAAMAIGSSHRHRRASAFAARASMKAAPAGARPFAATSGAMAQNESGTEHNTESYATVRENTFKLAAQDPLSTFSIDVDTASYANARRFLNDGQLPPPDAVRIEEFVNYFRYTYPAPQGNEPFSSHATVASCPWAPMHKLVQIGLRARDIEHAQRPNSNLVFLIDVSGSMDDPLKLPLLVRSMRMLVDELDERDRVAIVVYAGSSGLVLPSTNCSSKAVIVGALDRLQAGGSTNGGEGIELAYKIAAENFIADGQNRVVLCTDGDFNVGVTSEGALTRLVEEKRKSKVFLSVLGFGRGNVKDSTMELLADKGNGNYAYVDSLNEARKVLVAEMGGTLFTVAKDVKIQVEFNPTLVQAWRLIGYENRVLAHQDFNDDTKDAGEIGAGHTVTAMYEVVPFGARLDVPGIDPLRYQQPPKTTAAAYTDELLTLKLRYKSPGGDTSQLISTPVKDTNAAWQEAGPDFQFAAAVAGFGMVLRKSPNANGCTLADVLNMATLGVGDDAEGYRAEFLALVRKAQALAK